MQSLNPLSPVQPLGPRLQTIFDIVAQAQQEGRYNCVWDCCCDHGYLGISILNEALCEKLYFVDQVPHIIKRLVPKLEEYPAEKFDLFSADAGALKFNPAQRHLVILAGISGKTIINVVQAIKKSHPNGRIDFILCPTNAIYNVREFLHLSQAELSLTDELFVTEKKRHYEVIYVSAVQESCLQDNSLQKSLLEPGVSLTGNLWDGENKVHQHYLKNLIKHYQRESQGENRDRSKRILKEYQDCFAQVYGQLETV